MKKGILATIIALLSVIPITSVTGDDNVPGDDLLENFFFGYVYDNVTKENLKGANVYAFDHEFKEYYGTISDDSGYYRLDISNVGTYYIYAYKEGYDEHAFICIIYSFDDHKVNLSLNPITRDYPINGIVVDQDTDELMSDVHITVLEMVKIGIFNPRTEYTTNTSGEFSFRLENGTYQVTFIKEDYYADSFTWIVDGNGLHLTKTMRKYYQGVYGRVTDESGDPISNVAVTIENNDYRFSEMTDDEGNFEIRMPSMGDYTLSTYADGYRPFSRPIQISGDMKEVDIEMKVAYVPIFYRILYAVLSMLGFV